MIAQHIETTNNRQQTELEGYAAFLELLSQIDQRLKNEDPEYRAKYYPEELTHAS